MKLLKRLFREEEGVTMVEYGLLVVAIAFLVYGGAVLFGEGLAEFFEDLGNALSTANVPKL